MTNLFATYLGQPATLQSIPPSTAQGIAALPSGSSSSTEQLRPPPSQGGASTQTDPDTQALQTSTTATQTNPVIQPEMINRTKQMDSPPAKKFAGAGQGNAIHQQLLGKPDSPSPTLPLDQIPGSDQWANIAQHFDLKTAMRLRSVNRAFPPMNRTSSFLTKAEISSVAELEKVGIYFPKIKELGFAIKSAFSDFNPRIALRSLTALRYFKNLTELQKLDLTNADTGDAVCLESLPNPYELQILLGSRLHGFAGKNIEVIGRFKNLKQLMLTSLGEITDEKLEFLKQIDALETLDLDELAEELNGSGLSYLKQPEALRILRLQNSKINGDGARQIAGLTGLQELDLRGCSSLNDEIFSHWSGLTQLRTLNLEECSNLTDADLTQLPALPHLTHLNLSGLSQLTDVALETIAAKFPNLQTLKLGGSGITDAGLAHIAKLKKLSQITIADSDITGVGLMHLQTLSNLKLLDLNHSSKLTDEGVGCIKSLGGLTHLNLEDCDEISGESLVNSAEDLPKLGSLNLSNCQALTDAGMGSVAQLSSLVELDLSRGAECLGIEGWQHVAKLGKLESLKLGLSPGLTDDALAQLSGLRSLRRLEFSTNCQITDAGLSRLGVLPNLIELKAGFCSQITGLAFAKIGDASRFPTLQQLNLPACNSINDDGVSCISQLESLQALSVRFCNHLTPNGFSKLSAVQKLRELEARDTAFSKDNLSLLDSMTQLKLLNVSKNRGNRGIDENDLADAQQAHPFKTIPSWN